MQKSENVNAWNSVNNVKKERAAAAADSGIHRRRDKHVEGVSFDTSIAKKSPEVRELPIDPKTAKGPEKPEFIIHRADPEPADYGKENMTNEPEQKTPESENDPKTQEKPARRKNPKMGAAGMADEVADVAASVAADSVKPKKSISIRRYLCFREENAAEENQMRI